NALQSVFNLFQPIAMRVAFVFHRNEADAEDTVQQVFLLLIHSKAKCKAVYDGTGKEVKSWLLTILYNVARRQVNKNAKTVPLEDGWEVEDRHQKGLEKDDRSGVVKDALLALPKKYRVPIILKYKEDMSV